MIATTKPTIMALSFSTTTATTFSPPPSLRGVFVGSGSDGMSDPRIAKVILELVPKKNEALQVLYLGTATYDLPQFAQRQTQCLVDQGCTVNQLKLVHECDPIQSQAMIDAADIIVVGGGNTLYAVDRWQTTGIVPHLQRAMERGAVLTGGSAGAICWFSGGHSDSMDPDSYFKAMQAKFGVESTTSTDNDLVEESSDAPDNGKKKDWKYIRVPGLGFLPGLMCPHHDRVQSNGILRARDFDQMLLNKHSGEIGIGIDHWAAFVVDGPDSYRVVSLEGKPGSVIISSNENNNGEPSFSPDAKGSPGIWIKHVSDGKVVSKLLPPSGKLSDVLRPATAIFEDQKALDQCRLDNPGQAYVN